MPLPLGPERPNLILVSFDTLRASQLGWHGGPPVTPNIDRFFDRSFVFRRAFAQFPSTFTSHATLFTGLYPKNHGAYLRLGKGFESRSIAGALGKLGYVTIAVTENAYVGSDLGFDRGFDFFENGTADRAFWNLELAGDAKKTFARARRQLERFADTRFFLFLHTYEVHAPYVLRDAKAREVIRTLNPGYRGPFRSSFDFGLIGLAYNSGEAKLPRADLRQLRALYTAEVNYLDRVWGEFAGFLEEHGLLKNTLVVLTSDHGEEFGEHEKLGHGESLSNQVLHVPLAFRWDGEIPPGESGVPCGLVDVAPTLLDLLAVERPWPMDGRSLVPAMRGNASEFAGRVVFSELDTAAGECKRLGKSGPCLLDRVAVQDGRFKLVQSKLPRFERLYDLARDPGEKRNVADEFPEERRRLARLAGQYARGSREGVSATQGPATLGPDTEERLRILGYR